LILKAFVLLKVLGELVLLSNFRTEGGSDEGQSPGRRCFKKLNLAWRWQSSAHRRTGTRDTAGSGCKYGHSPFMMARTMLKIIIWCARNAGGENSNSSIMVVHFKQAGKRIAAKAFSLIEVLVAVVILLLVMSGLMYGYVEANRMAEWSSQSLAATSYALQGMEQLRSAQWCAEENPSASGQGTTDVLGNYFQTNQVDTLDIPTTGAPIYVTNTITGMTVTNADGTTRPPLKRLISQVVWTFPLTGQLFTNTIVTLRAPDQLQ